MDSLFADARSGESLFPRNSRQSRYQATSMLKDAGMEATEEEWTRAELAIRQRRGARPPTAAVVTVMVKPNQDLNQILQGQQTACQDRIVSYPGTQFDSITVIESPRETTAKEVRR
jgi:hypothetical protein